MKNPTTTATEAISRREKKTENLQFCELYYKLEMFAQEYTERKRKKFDSTPLTTVDKTIKDRIG